MPYTLSRSIMVIIIPGIVALAPWALWVVSKIPNFSSHYSSYATLINSALIGLAIILGSILEGALTHLEVKWDKQCEKEYNVKENWFNYLAQQCAAEPVGFKYISRLATTMYFELSMMAASPIALVGVAVLVFDYAHSSWRLGGIVLLLFAAAIVAWFYWQAKNTHGVLCEARKELNTRMKNER